MEQLTLSLIGVGIIALGVFILHLSRKKAQTCTAEIIAEITRIDSYRRRDDTKHDVYIEYKYAGETYETKLGSYNSSMRVGNTVNIYVNPENPEEIYDKSGYTAAVIILFVLGIIFVVGGFIAFFNN